MVGLAWTEVGGDLLTIEAALTPGKGAITRTGSLGDVMKESVAAARTVVRSRARALGIKDEVFEKRDMHIHVPDGATPKDGPSAGAAMTTAIVSALTGIPVRGDVAMTGEITLRGEVTAIGAAATAGSSSGSGVGWRSSASSSTWSIHMTGTISSPFLTFSGMSARSLTFSSGISTVLMPPRCAANSFSFRPGWR